MPASVSAAVLDFSRDIYSVSRLNTEVRAVLDGSFPLLWVQGELSNLSQPASGHIYFGLKDSASQVRCAMFRPKRRLLAFRPGNGQQVLVRARVGLYEPRGDYQLIVEQMEPAGEGALRIALERLKQRLGAEGLFAEDHKQPLPAYPAEVGVITSASGAALHDVLTVLRRRFALLPVLIYPAQVQGEGAVASLVAAIERANRRRDCELLILARGGGSLEDLMAFNDEALARAIHASSLPVVTGVGHEVDLTIADLVADQRGATPSAAAERVAPDGAQARTQLQRSGERLRAGLDRRCKAAAERLNGLARQLQLLHPRGRLERQAQRVDELERRLLAALRSGLGQRRSRLEALRLRQRTGAPARGIAQARARLEGLALRLRRAQMQQLAQRRRILGAAVGGLEARSPLATLARGYALVTDAGSGALVRDWRQAPPGMRLRVRLAAGVLEATVSASAAAPAARPGGG